MKTKKKLVRGRKGKDAKTAKMADAAEDAADAGEDFPHANTRHDMRQWAVIVLAAGFIGYFAPSVAGVEAQIKDAAVLGVSGVVAWAVASYLPLPKIKRIRKSTNARKRGRRA